MWESITKTKCLTSAQGSYEQDTRFICSELEHSYLTAYITAHEVLHGLIDLSYSEIIHKFMVDNYLDEIRFSDFTLSTNNCLNNKATSNSSHHFHDSENLNSYKGFSLDRLTERDRGSMDIMLPRHKSLLNFYSKLRVINRSDLKNDFYIQLLMIHPLSLLYADAFNTEDILD